MTPIFSRTDRSFLSEWWWTVDRLLIFLVVALLAVGLLMAIAASPAVALTIGKGMYDLTFKQIVFLGLALVAFLGTSMLPIAAIKRLALAVFIISFIGLVATLFVGTSVKGASRWLTLGGFSLQPVEFLKPSFAIIIAWLFAEQRIHFDNRFGLLAFTILIIIGSILAAQPDMGQTVLLSVLWGGIYFLSGSSRILLGMLFAAGAATSIWLYTITAHVKLRVDRFFDPSLGNTYQVDKAMDAMQAGGVFGVGQGAGRVKFILPDAHSDYVFAVIAEEGGLLIGGITIVLFATLIWRAFSQLKLQNEHWVQLAGGGLVCLFALQVMVNLSVSMNLIPPKGMTLPFISYGGSSLLASAVGMGMLVGLIRRRSSAYVAPPASHAFPTFGGIGR